MTGESPTPACPMMSRRRLTRRALLFSPCSCPAACGREAQGRRRRRRGGEERVAGGGREQAVGGEVLPALHPLLAHALPRRRRPLQALRGTSTILLAALAFRSICGFVDPSWNEDWILIQDSILAACFVVMGISFFLLSILVFFFVVVVVMCRSSRSWSTWFSDWCQPCLLSSSLCSS